MIQESEVRGLPPQALSGGQESKFKNQQSKSVLIFFLLFTIHCSLFTVFSGCASSNVNKKEDADIHYKLGVVHLNEGNIPDALKELTAAVETYPDDATFHNALGLAYFARGMHEDAIKHLQKAVKTDPKFSDAHTNLAAVYLEIKQWDAAISEAKSALSNIFYATPELAYFNMGRGYYEKADYLKAEENYKKAMESNPRYLVAYNNLGLTYMKMNRDKEASDLFRLAIKNAPNYVDAHYNLGLVLLKAKDKKGAATSFQEVVKFAPDSDMAKSARGYIDLLK
ncbi:MAG: tetratricopeptide repeat protein [Deltaproteobacteria bacterium]|nr:tetratricopeptide repeat protein [Deltaproteobacteria bacterium]